MNCVCERYYIIHFVRVEYAFFKKKSLPANICTYDTVKHANPHPANLCIYIIIHCNREHSQCLVERVVHFNTIFF